MSATLEDPVEQMHKLEQTAHRMSAGEKAEHLLQRAKTKLVIGKDATSTFFAPLVMSFDYQVMWEVSTAGTDGHHLVYNPDFICGLDDEEVKTVLAHEAMHCAHKHFARVGTRQKLRANIAMDLAINPLLKEAGFKIPKDCCMPGEGSFSKMPVGLAFEEYYNLLPDMPDSPDGVDYEDPGNCGAVKRSGNGGDSDATTKQRDQEWSGRVAAAAQQAEKRGTLSAGLKRSIGAILDPQVAWEDALREFVTQTAKNKYSWKRPNRRLIGAGIYLPIQHGFEIGHIVAVIDCSGSIDEQTLTRFASELNGIAQVGVQKITIVYHDSKVCRVDEWTPDLGPLTLVMTGGGGTDHVPVFEHIDAMEERPEVAVLLTDLYSNFPDAAPEYPVMWVATVKDVKHPWGERVDITV